MIGCKEWPFRSFCQAFLNVFPDPILQVPLMQRNAERGLFINTTNFVLDDLKKIQNAFDRH